MNISVVSLSGDPVTVMCDPTEVRSYLYFGTCMRLSALIIHVRQPNVDFDRCWIHMWEWPFRANGSWGTGVRQDRE